jgi:Uma2 family endonuclease
MAVQEKLLTAEEFMMLPDNGNKLELDKGVVVEVSPPNFIHGLLSLRFGRFVSIFVDEKHLGWVTVETGFILSKNPDVVRAPDVAFISKDRLAKPDLKTFIPMAPDLAVEVVSPNDTASEINTKVQKYLQAGTQLVIVVYPDSQNIYTYQSDGQVRLLNIDDTLEGGNVLPGFTLSLRELFRDLGEESL